MSKLSFENAMGKLEKIVQELEAGGLSLEGALKKFEEGIKLSKLCSERLDEIERRVTILLRDEEGNPRAEPFQPETEQE
ncbi:exodeoxyribonuclease VII small subunit [Thermodesulfobacteriota bacterium]